MNLRKTMFFVVAAVMLFSVQAASQSADIYTIGGFEGSLPAYWTMGNQPTNATLTWATDQSRSLGHSLKITKTATSDTAAWISTNMCDIWSPTISANVDILLGAYVKTSGVNTNPTTDDQKWYVAYTFYDSAQTLIGTVKLPVDQTAATSTSWIADTSALGTVLPRNAWTLIVSFVGGKNATGTVWADDFILVGRGGAWAGQDWNTGVGVPTGWYYWLPPNGGNDGLLNSGFENTVVTNEAAHSGQYSLKFNMPLGRPAQDGFVGTKRIPFANLDAGDIHPGDSVRISVWIKASGLLPDSAAAHPTTWAVGITPQWDKVFGNNDGYNGTGPDYQFVFPSVTSFDWTQYSVTIQVPATVSGVAPVALETRLHVYSTFVGTVYFDDLTITKVDVPQLSAIGGFEGSLPAYWTMGNQPTNATLTWATDQSRSLGHSLKITKTATSDTAAWISTNMCDIWSPTISANVDILLGAYVKTSGVNTNPTADSAKWYIAYTFYDSAQTLIGTVKLPVDQTAATSTSWIADTSALGTVLPRNAWTLIVSFVGGKNATGTVWADDFILVGRGGAWAGQDWNTGVGVPTGWYYWLPPNGGNDGLLNSGFESTVVTTSAAHSGTHSLMFNMPSGRPAQDGFVGTKRIPFANLDAGTIHPGDSVRVTVWIKASGLLPDSAAAHPTTWAVGITPQWDKVFGNNDGYNGTGSDYQFVFPSVTSFDWTQYTLDLIVPATVSGAAPVALETRLHVYSTFVGTVYFDDLNVEKISSTTAVKGVSGNTPHVFDLSNNYPNPFNPSTKMNYSIPRDGMVSLVVYNVLGQQVRTLVNAPMTAGQYSITWDGRNNAGSVLSSGVYFYRLQSGAMAIVKKMLLLK